MQPSFGVAKVFKLKNINHVTAFNNAIRGEESLSRIIVNGCKDIKEDKDPFWRILVVNGDEKKALNALSTLWSPSISKFYSQLTDYFVSTNPRTIDINEADLKTSETIIAKVLASLNARQ